MDSLFDLTGRRALVTGAGQNLGAGIARTLAHIGADVVVNDLVEERARGVADEIRADGGTASIALFDVTDFESVIAGVDAAGPIDVLVNNVGNAGAAGWTGDGPFVDTTPSDWSPFFSVNLYGVMHCVRAVTPSMIQNNWGRVITIISDAARTGERDMAAYAAAKAGAAGFTRAYAREVGRYDITANNIAIGSMHRPTSDVGDTDRGGGAAHERRVPSLHHSPARRTRRGRWPRRLPGQSAGCLGLRTDVPGQRRILRRALRAFTSKEKVFLASPRPEGGPERTRQPSPPWSPPPVGVQGRIVRRAGHCSTAAISGSAVAPSIVSRMMSACPA